MTWSRSGWRRIRRVEVLVEGTARGRAFAEAGRPALELLRVLGGAAGRGAADRLVHEVRADLEVHRDVLARVEPLDEVRAPGDPVVGPGRDRVLVAAHLVDDERGAPAVVAERLHRDLDPRAAGGAMAERGEDDVVSVGERVGLDDDPVAGHALDREAAAVDERRDPLDHGTTAPIPDVGADVGQWSAADRVLLGMRSRRGAADERGLGCSGTVGARRGACQTRPAAAPGFVADTNHDAGMRADPGFRRR